jgi:hypothetical protein
MAKRGRKTLYTPERVEALIKALEAGLPHSQACDIVGLGHRTFYAWKASKPEFASEVARAEAKVVVDLLGIINRASEQHWQAAAWILERRWPERWGRRVIQHDNSAAPMKIEVVWQDAVLAASEGMDDGQEE